MRYLKLLLHFLKRDIKQLYIMTFLVEGIFGGFGPLYSINYSGETWVAPCKFSFVRATFQYFSTPGSKRRFSVDRSTDPLFSFSSIPKLTTRARLGDQLFILPSTVHCTWINLFYITELWILSSLGRFSKHFRTPV